MSFADYARKADELLQDALKPTWQKSEEDKARVPQLIAAAEVYARLADAASRLPDGGESETE
ncbi:hypothetical protein [Streptomyces boninensis]|uniref:hypothetical protein n=1 Tax=Streptomyces boninensis TaxID=2039455 RepID=UPI003B2234C8